MLERSDDYPKGGLSRAQRDNSFADPKGEAQPNKSHKKVGGVLFNPNPHLETRVSKCGFGFKACII